MSSPNPDLVAFFFTDIEGSTRLAQSLGSDYAEVLNQHNHLIRNLIESYKGREVQNTGDGFFIAFEDPILAVKAAMEIQKALSDHQWPHDISMRVRIAIHWGQAISSGTGYTGLEVHRTSRICDASHGEQILLSKEVTDEVLEHLPLGVSLNELGTYFLKDFEEPTTLFQLSVPGLRAEFPMLQAKAITPIVTVLPFTNRSGDAEQDFFCDGIAEEINLSLTRIPGLRVVPYTTLVKKGESFDVLELGKGMDTMVVLEGSVRITDGQIRIMVELVDISSGFNVWSKRYNKPVEDIFAVQDEIAQSVAHSLEIKLVPEHIRQIKSVQTQDIEAYANYLKGRRFYYQYSFQSIEFAIQLFKKAVEADRKYALAYCGLADCHSYLYMYHESSDDNLKEADRYSKQAIKLDPNLSESFASRGLALSLSKEFKESETAFKKAIDLDPYLFESNYYYARAQFAQGKLKSAAELFEKAHRLRTEDYQSLFLAGQCYEGIDLPDEAVTARRRGIEVVEAQLKLNPGDIRALYLGANGLVSLGEVRKGLQWLQRALTLEPDDAMLLYNAACIYAMSGMKNEALNCLEKSVKCGVSQKEWYLNDSNLDSVREDPRFKQILGLLK